VSRVLAGGVDLGPVTDLAELVRACARVDGPGVTVLYPLASGRGTLTATDIDHARTTLAAIAAHTAIPDGVRAQARSLHTTLTRLRANAPHTLST